MLEPEQIKKLAKAVIETEVKAIQALSPRIDDHFVTACQIILACSARVIVTGMGKSGHIGRKIAATLASTGTPAFFVHPGEASHGDLGMITSQDVVIAISNSGQTDELTAILPIIKLLGVPLITMTGNPHSLLAREAQVHLDISVPTEACPMNLAPTSSTTATLVMGDALAVALLEQRGFTEDDFARSHPGGTLGRRLLLHVKDLMHTGDQLPRVHLDTTLPDALHEMTSKGLGMTSIVDNDNKVLGIFTDGDLRRLMDDGIDLYQTKINQIYRTGCKTTQADVLAVDALRQMELDKITSMLVVDDAQQLVGAIHLHDVLKAGIK